MTLELMAEIRNHLHYSLEWARSKKLDPMAIAKAKAKTMTMTMAKADAMECLDVGVLRNA